MKNGHTLRCSNLLAMKKTTQADYYFYSVKNRINLPFDNVRSAFTCPKRSDGCKASYAVFSVQAYPLTQS